MHEFSIVEQLVTELSGRLRQNAVSRVEEVHLRRNSTFSEDALRLAFEMYATGTPLEGARLVIETAPVMLHCGCGHEQLIDTDDVHGHMVLCPLCGAVHEVDEAHDLALTRLIAADRPQHAATP